MVRTLSSTDTMPDTRAMTSLDIRAISSVSISVVPSGSASTSPSPTMEPFSTTAVKPSGRMYSSAYSSELVTRILRPSVSSDTSTTPSISDSTAWPFGVRASNNSSTLGRPLVMSCPATPPVWKVRIVSWVPGSPMLWAAMIPTASPIMEGLIVARDMP